MESNLVSKKEAYLKDALYDGINSKAICETLESLANSQSFPKQAADTVEVIADMKDVPNKSFDERFVSDFLKKNSDSIILALKDGISPNEIANSLLKNLNEENSLDSREKLNFMVNLITKMKQKELSLIKSAYQKTLN